MRERVRHNAVNCSGLACRIAVASRAPVSNGASCASGRSSRVSWERGACPSQPCRKGVTAAVALAHPQRRLVFRQKSRRRCWWPHARCEWPQTGSALQIQGWPRRCRRWPRRIRHPRRFRVGYGERRRVAVNQRYSGRLTVGKLDRQPKAEVRAGHAQLVFSHLIEQPRPIAQNYRHAGDRVPDHVAKAAQPGKRQANAVPVRMQRHIFGCSDGHQALCG